MDYKIEKAIMKDNTRKFLFDIEDDLVEFMNSKSKLS